MLEDLEKGDVAETISKFFQQSKHCRPTKNSHLTVQDVDSFLRELSQLTKEDDQTHLFSQLIEKCTSNDLLYIIRLVKNDLRINAGAKHVLDAIHADAYQALQTSRDLDSVLETVFGVGIKQDPGSPTKSLHISVKLMTPVLPMLAEACKSVEQALKKCPKGMYSEIKYDGERVQVHKSGSDFKYFSRSLKPVMPHKVREFHDLIPKAFPGGEDLILDSEILMIDTKTGQPLPFGTLGKHKRGEYKDACVCLFVFDCIYYNGKSLLHKPMKKRRKILHEHMTEIPNRILFSETQEVYTAKDLENMMTKVFQLGLEGLVLKGLEGSYEPGKRHWLKVKKDYLFGGAMADSADLVVLGAWFGTGQKGGMMSVFLMGCWDPARKHWCTVTKVHTGHDDKTLERLQGELQMIKISKEGNKVPSWLKCTKTMIPDFVAENPKHMPVWEITGAEFTKHDVHTADGISIRFPRVTRIRDDKTWKEATSLPELKALFDKSKDTSDFQLPSYIAKDDDSDVEADIKEKPERKKKKKNKTEDDDSPESKSERSESPKLKIEKEDSPKPLQERESSPESKQRNLLPKNKTRDRSSSKSIEVSEEGKQSSSPVPAKSKHYEETEDPLKKFVIDIDEEMQEESVSTKIKKKRRESDSSDSDVPLKKAKLCNIKKLPSSHSSPSSPSSCQDIAEMEVDVPLEIVKPDADKRQNLESYSSNCELFVKLLVSEMQEITDPRLYHRVKGELFNLIHKAQEEQFRLNSYKIMNPIGVINKQDLISEENLKKLNDKDCSEASVDISSQVISNQESNKIEIDKSGVENSSCCESYTECTSEEQSKEIIETENVEKDCSKKSLSATELKITPAELAKSEIVHKQIAENIDCGKSTVNDCDVVVPVESLNKEEQAGTNGDSATSAALVCNVVKSAESEKEEVEIGVNIIDSLKSVIHDFDKSPETMEAINEVVEKTENGKTEMLNDKNRIQRNEEGLL